MISLPGGRETSLVLDFAILLISGLINFGFFNFVVHGQMVRLRPPATISFTTNYAVLQAMVFHLK